MNARLTSSWLSLVADESHAYLWLPARGREGNRGSKQCLLVGLCKDSGSHPWRDSRARRVSGIR